jgi:MOSC domain-containing protein YiiM
MSKELEVEKKMSVVKRLKATFARNGKLETIVLRPVKQGDCIEVDAVEVDATGLVGDHHANAEGNRQVTFINKEHLAVAGAMINQDPLDPKLTRRNLVISGINLLAVIDQKFSIGEVVFQGTRDCRPCARMEENFGPGAYNAMAGHGGICASVIKGGTIRVGDEVQYVAN